MTISVPIAVGAAGVAAILGYLIFKKPSCLSDAEVAAAVTDNDSGRISLANARVILSVLETNECVAQANVLRASVKAREVREAALGITAAKEAAKAKADADAAAVEKTKADAEAAYAAATAKDAADKAAKIKADAAAKDASCRAIVATLSNERSASWLPSLRELAQAAIDARDTAAMLRVADMLPSGSESEQCMRYLAATTRKKIGSSPADLFPIDTDTKGEPIMGTRTGQTLVGLHHHSARSEGAWGPQQHVLAHAKRGAFTHTGWGWGWGYGNYGNGVYGSAPHLPAWNLAERDLDLGLGSSGDIGTNARQSPWW